MSNINQYKSLLFVPANRPDRFKKAAESGAGTIIIDLEDSVNDHEKGVGRANILAYDKTNLPFWVRINAQNSPHYADDVALLGECRNLVGIVVPKAECVQSLMTLHSTAHLPMLIVIETPTGVAQVRQLASVAGVCGVSFGVLDLGRAFGVVFGTVGAMSVFDHIRFEILLACRLANVAAIESIVADFKDTNRFLQNADNAFAMGFCGQLCIHPSQVILANLAYTPSDEQYAFATAVIDEYNRTQSIAFGLNGIMVDLPVIEWAKNIIKSKV